MIRLLQFMLLLYAMRVRASDQIEMFVADLQPGWPTMFAAIIPQTMKLSDNAVYEWRFGGDKTYTCTSNGTQNLSPCRGKTAQYVFQREGEYDVSLSVSDRSLKNPVTINKTIRIRPLSEFPVVQRPEIRSVPRDRWNKVVNALYRLAELGVYWDLCLMHEKSVRHGFTSGTNRTAAHQGPSFLLFHRLLMRVVERSLQVALNDDNFGLPFMDWTLRWNGLEAYVGESGDSSGVVVSGPFCNHPTEWKSGACPKRWVLPPEFPDNVKAIKRRIGAEPFIPFHTEQQRSYLLNMSYYDLPPFDDSPIPNSFRSALEGGLGERDPRVGLNHNGIHRWISGTMGNVALAMYDPIFLLHHSEVDRLLTMWQKIHGCTEGQGSAVCYRPGDSDPGITSATRGARKEGNKFILRGHSYSEPLYPWNVKISEILPSFQGYGFLEPGEPPQHEKPPTLQNRNNQTRRSTSGSSRKTFTLNYQIPLMFTTLFILYL